MPYCGYLNAYKDCAPIVRPRATEICSVSLQSEIQIPIRPIDGGQESKIQMILYNENQSPSLIDFGILIPIHNSKASKTLERLRSHPVLGHCVDRWYRSLEPETITRDDLLRVHSEDYVQRLYSAELEEIIVKTFELIDDHGKYYRYDPERARLPLKLLFDRILERVSGTAQCCRIALSEGFCFYFGGGMHHAHHKFGHGFCVLNDIVIGIRKVQAEKRVRNVWVIDVDAHKGDGTAAITANDATITTLSAHMANGWPMDIQKYDAAGRLHPSFIASDVDIPVEAGEEGRYVEWLAEGLSRMEQIRKPDLAVVVDGADPFAEDELPSTQVLKLSLDQLKERDRFIYDFLRSRRIPAAFLMAGGYGSNSWKVYTQFLEWALPKHLGLVS